MESIYVGKVKRSKVDKDSADLYFVDHRQDIQYFGNVIEYDDTAYCLVPADDIIINNDELLKLRDEVKRLTEACNGWEDECNDWKKRYAKANNELFQKCLAYGTLEGAYKNEKIAGELLLKDRDILKEDRDRWKNRWNTVVTDIGESLKANGITFVLKEIDDEGNWDIVIDIPELNEAKKKVEDLEKKLKAAKSNETFWLDRKEEEEDYHHYWLHTYDLAVGLAADEGVRIFINGENKKHNVGVVLVKNEKASDLESQVIQMEDVHNKKWSAMTEALKEKGVEVIYMGEEDGKPIVDVKIPKLDELHKESEARAHQIDILGKDYVVRGQEIDKLKKELEDLKSRTLDKVEIRLSYGDIMWTYCDGFVHLSSKIDGMSFADQITTAHINCLCKNHVAVDAESISHGTIPTCKSCAHYMHNPSRFAHDWCYMPIPKEGGAGYIRKLSTEEAENPACSDYKARKE